MRQTDGNSGMLFNIALNYGGRAEIVDAARRALAAGIRPDDLDERRFGEFLYTAGQPDPDLLIRTSGEMRVSNFLLWQIAYSEIWVTETLWPDFRRRHLLEAVVAYQKRDRRYGGIKPSPRVRSRSAPSEHARRFRRQRVLRRRSFDDARSERRHPARVRDRRRLAVAGRRSSSAVAELLLVLGFVEYAALARNSGLPVPAIPAGCRGDADVRGVRAAACARADRRRADVGARRARRPDADRTGTAAATRSDSPRRACFRRCISACRSAR